MRLSFEWHPEKAELNERKHKVTFAEASTVFNDPLYITVLDVEHSIDEDRYITIGPSSTGRMLLVAHTDRNDRIRIISAREATRNERRFYSEGL